MNLWVLTDAQGRVMNLCRHDMTGQSGWTASSEDALGVSLEAPLFDASGACLYTLSNGALSARSEQARAGDVPQSAGIVYNGVTAAAAANSTLFDAALDCAEGALYRFELLGKASARCMFNLYVNHDLTNGNYIKKYVYDGSTTPYVTTSLVGFANSASYASRARGDISMLGGRTFITGINLRGEADHRLATFAFSHLGASTSLQIVCDASALAGCRLRLWRL